jgi:hypothetical protein
MAIYNILWQTYLGDTRLPIYLRHCARSRKVASSIIDETFGIFHWHNPSSPNMALGSTQSFKEMITRNISWGGGGGKGGRCIGLTTLPPTCANCLEIVGALTSPSRKGLSRPVYGLLYKRSCVNMELICFHSHQHKYCLIFLNFSEESSYSK